MIRDWVHKPPLPPSPPPTGQAEQRPPAPSTGPLPPPSKLPIWDQPQWKPHFGLQIWIRGHSSDTRWTWRVFLAKRHFSKRSGSWARDQRRLTSFSIALLYGALRKSGLAGTTRTNPWQAGTGQELIYVRRTIVLLPHSATTLGGDHTFRHIEKKHYQRDQRKNRLLWIAMATISKRSEAMLR